jgi:hypothetical protein
MPEISRFLGIVIYMNFNDHLPPHFHARYSDYEITVEIESCIIEGKFPPRALSLVLDWAKMHRKELLDNWNSITTTGVFNKIKPLE